MRWGKRARVRTYKIPNVCGRPCLSRGSNASALRKKLDFDPYALAPALENSRAKAHP